ncbi:MULTISPECIES: hypothetical protein [Enterobacter cloacae complex]|uniref:hypothetical protein n=1 Tax=Enterobacter cloacae complex TaxID=354276 RepID=UPI00107E93E1|nr:MULTISPECIES: hypothetical protein [Enterobacter cloacae complex]MBT2048679.1 hypothetical protein [Enterobacter asburiae]MCK7075375.1 hypothetical protein [Enterobacter roggenkampii]QBX86447.1 hypothetical protein E4005_17900 [Enterobacter roggenkampii]UWI98769.1 hypothetical protein N0B38_08955 [Enterobacter roggenkampii]
MHKIYAVIANGLVTNTIVWNGKDDFNLNEGEELVEVPSQSAEFPTPSIGWIFLNGEFVDPGYHE